jgi:putative ABC transport system substrate-binding protein
MAWMAFGLLALALGVDVQAARPPSRIAVLHSGFFQVTPVVVGLKEGLAGQGLEEGRDVVYDVRYTRGSAAAIAAAVAAVTAGRYDLIYTWGEEVSRAVKAAAVAVPVVFSNVGDPVAAELVTSIARPGGNITGVYTLDVELVPKRLEMLKAVVPGLRRVWAVHHADDLSMVAMARRAQQVGPDLSLEVLARAVRSPEEAARELKAVRPGDALLAPSPLTANIPGLMLDLGLQGGVPGVFAGTFWTQAGGLLSYGSDTRSEGEQAARLVAKILRGTHPRDLPVEGSHRIELAVNLKAAKSMGLTVPPAILTRAEQVIE